MSEALLWPIALALLGAVIGSFAATVAIRWPEGRSAMRGRSACDGCGRTLHAAELVPLLSALVSRGRCRTCGATIDPRHRRIELAAAAIGLASGLVAPGFEGVAGAAFGWLLLTLAAIDAAVMILPDEISLTTAIIALVTWWFGVLPPIEDRLIGAAVGFLALWSIAVLYRVIRGRDGLGEGDPKLLCVIGLWLGWQPLPYVLMFAALIGLGSALVARLRGGDIGWASEVPFGTFLAIAAYPAWLVMIASAP